jgi:hypothetical protein
MQPRIYTYKITFEEIPHWYWGVHKEKKFGELYLGSPVTHKWVWDFYTPRIQILEFFPHSGEGWKEARKVEDRLIIPDLDKPLCLNEHYGGILSLEVCSAGGRKVHEEKDENGKSKHAIKMATRAIELGVGATTRTLEKMSEDGRKGAEAGNAKKDEFGRSVNSVRGAEAMNSKKDKNGKSLNAVKGGKRGAVSTHEVKDENGKSVNAKRAALVLHSVKDDMGRSVHTMKTINNRWRSTVDGFESNAGNVASHNRANGWPPEARVKVP